MKKQLLATMAILLLFLSLTAFQQTGAVPVSSAQQQTSYPAYEEPTATGEPGSSSTANPGYPAPLTTELAGTSTINPNLPTVTHIPTRTAYFSLTPSATPTRSRNLFSTEDAELSGAVITQRASQTEGPTRTQTPTLTPTQTVTPTPTPPMNIDRGWFMAGLLIPAGLLFLVWLVLRMKNSGEFQS